MGTDTSKKNTGGSFFKSLKTGFTSLFSGKKEAKGGEKLISKDPPLVDDKEKFFRDKEIAATEGVKQNPKSTKMIMRDNYDDLVKSLRTETIPYIKKYAALKLGEMGDKRAIEHLVVAIRDENFEVRMAAAQALGKLGDESLVQKLVDTLSDSNEYLKEQTIQVLAQMGEVAVSALIKALHSDNWMLPYSAVKALGKIKDPKAIKALVELLEDDSNVYVQKEAIDALQKLGKDAEPELVKALSHNVWCVREKAAQILATTGSEENIERLRKAIESEEDEVTRERIKKCLTKLLIRFKKKDKNED